MAEKISNALLEKVVDFSSGDISASVMDCAKSLNLKGTTLASWQRNFKQGKWPLDYKRTADGTPLNPDLTTQFVNAFSFGGHASKILKKLVTPKCLHNKYCFAKQHKILKRLFKKYPNINFWLHVDFGEPRDDILLFLGKAEPQLRKKYLDFSASDDYTPFEYTFTPPPSTTPSRKRIKTIWDYYD